MSKDYEEEFNTRETPHKPVQIVYDGTIGSYSRIMAISKAKESKGFLFEGGQFAIPTAGGFQEVKEGDIVCLKPDGNVSVIKKGTIINENDAQSAE